MPSLPSGGPGSLVLVALAPAALAWWRGRSLSKRLDDPALPERLASQRQASAVVLGVALASLALLSLTDLWWTVPLLFLSRLISAYPTRRRLFGDTWSLTTYLGFVLRLLFGIWAFWLVLALTPVAARLTGSSDWLTGALLAAVLFAWNARFPETLVQVLGARALDDPSILTRCIALAQTSDTAVPHFLRLDLNGGVIANAVAVPSLKRSAVIFTDTLLERLDDDEVLAICAHELAHLEYFNPTRLRRMNRLTMLLIGVSMLIAPLARLTMPSGFLILYCAWVFAILTVFAWRARHRQRNETDSDVRAVALTGDANALPRALTKMCQLARMPRRLPPTMEERSTHPSLARRVQAIREAAGVNPSGPFERVTVASPDGALAATFDESKLEWREGDGVEHHLSYSHLTELRLDAARSGRAALVAVEATGRRWRMRLDDGDIARVQGVLDLVDGRLAVRVVPDPISAGLPRTLAAAAALASLVASQIVAALVASLVLARVDAPLLAAAGVGTVAAGVLALRDSTPFGPPVDTWLACLLCALGLGLCVAAWIRRHEPVSQATKVLVVALGGFAACSLGFAALQGDSAVRLYQAARAIPATSVLSLALAGALACWGQRAIRYAAIPAALAGIATMLVGSTLFLERTARDPFFVKADPLALETLDKPPAREFSIPVLAWQLRLSDDGRYVAVIEEDVNEGTQRTFHMGRAGGNLTTVQASDMTFLPGSRALLLATTDVGSSIRLVALERPTDVIWSQAIPGLAGLQLLVREGSDRWQVLGWDRRDIVRAEGRIGGEDLTETRWRREADSVNWPRAIGSSGSDALVVETHFDGFADGAFLWLTAYLRMGFMSSTLWRLHGTSRATAIGVSHLETLCRNEPSTQQLVCTAFDGVHTRIVWLDPGTGRVAPIGLLSGRFHDYGHGGTGWLTGWHESSLVALSLAERRGFRLTNDGGPVAVAASNRRLATIAPAGDRSTIRLYDLIP